MNIFKRGVSRVKQSRFPMSIFWWILGIMLIIAGVHQGLLIGLEQTDIPPIVTTHIIVFFWIGVAIGLTLFIRGRMKKTYDTPLQEISAATKRVAKGDFSVRIEPFHGPDKQEDYLDQMVRDLNLMIEELGSIETLKTDFISNVSHEMKTPLAVIKNYAELMQSECISVEKQREYAAVIEEAAGKMSDLISNILRLNRLEHQKIVPERLEYDLCRQLADCIIQFEDRWEQKSIDLDVDLEDQAMVRADENLLELVWNNLLSNAIKFTEPGGTITVRQRTIGREIQVSVSDTGCGMTEDVKNRIFDKFYQGDTSHATEGNGLGLALVQRVLTLTGGTIEVASESGSGSTFTVKLPKAE